MRSPPIPSSSLVVYRKESKVGMGEDDGKLTQDVGCAGLKRLTTVNSKVYWWKTGKENRDARRSMYA
jgi:hypothetical protein